MRFHFLLPPARFAKDLYNPALRLHTALATLVIHQLFQANEILVLN
jgi:hypothetical protein